MIDRIGSDKILNSREQATEYYSKSRSFDKLIDCYFLMEDFESLENVSVTIEDSTVLKVPSKFIIDQKIAQKFFSVGQSNQAVDIYLKLNDFSAAIQCCVLLNEVKPIF